MILNFQLTRYAPCVESLLNGGLYLTCEQYLPNDLFLIDSGWFPMEEAKQNMDPPGYPPRKLTYPLKMDGWNTILSYWVSAYFQVQTVSFRECTMFQDMTIGR